jgi:hypothetical protein
MSTMQSTPRRQVSKFERTRVLRKDFRSKIRSDTTVDFVALSSTYRSTVVAFDDLMKKVEG